MPETHHLTYEGPPRGANAFAQMLRDEGLTVDWQRPDETRTADLVQDVVIYFAIRASDDIVDLAVTTAVRAAIAKFRARFPGKARIDEDDSDTG